MDLSSTRGKCISCEALQPVKVLAELGCQICGAAQSQQMAQQHKKQMANVEKAEQLRLEKEELKAEENKAEALKAQKKELEFNVKKAAAKEIAARELARRHYLPFIKRFHPEYVPGWFHKDLCLRLAKFSDAVARGESPRLMLFVPPRHGKTLTTSKTFPSWHLGKYPEHEFICCSYSSALANDFSRANRAIIADPDFQKIFPSVHLDKDNKSVEQWAIKGAGGMAAAGVGGAITGKGAHILLIDDPVKNAEEADSFNARQTIKDWYTSTAYTRLAPGGGVIVIMTRWHDDDLAGWLLTEAAKGADQWEVVKYPARAEHDEEFRKKGEALHPVRYGVEALERIQKMVGPRTWSALYQQNPVAEDGTYFLREDFKLYRPEQLPKKEEMVFFTAWDFAIGQKQYNDYTVGLTVGIDRSENIWIVGLEKGRWDAMQIVDKILRVQKLWGAAITGVEKGHIQGAIGPFLRKRIQETRSYKINLEELTPGRSDKVARGRSIQGRARQGMVYVPTEASWMQGFINECLRFPNGVHDDQVDAFAWIGIMLDKFFVSYAPRAKKKKSWKDKLAKHVISPNKKSPMTS